MWIADWIFLRFRGAEQIALRHGRNLIIYSRCQVKWLMRGLLCVFVIRLALFIYVYAMQIASFALSY
jgi:hypothetical protein